MLAGMGKLRQKIASFISASIFLGLVWLLIRKVHFVIWVNFPWWGFLLVMVLLFFFIDTMVSRSIGAKEPVERKKEQVVELGHKTKDATSAKLESIREKLRETDQ
jgi:hypothetical protein